MKSHKTLPLLFLSLFILNSCGDEVQSNGPKPPSSIELSDSFYVEVDLTNRPDDNTFKVRMFVDDLTLSNAIYQFPATVPGTYDIFDIGRFVLNFKAYDKNHRALDVLKISTNQWQLSDPEATRIIEFDILETFDTPVTEHSIYKMAGTSIESDHTLLNTFDVIGYPEGLKERDFYLKVIHPKSWTIGTSLQTSEQGFYFATDYDKFVDSPLLIGKISDASTTVDNSTIHVYTYSKNNLIESNLILPQLQSVLNDASAFLNGLPVDRYSFIYFFDQFNAGALEHSYSSVYVLQEQFYSTNLSSLRSIAAHEFFHVVTPLNIHSEIIEDFNFAVPTASEHLWLYEGVTEWAAHMMQYRNNHLTLTSLLNRFRNKKLTIDAYYDPLVSLSQMSLTCYGEGGSQFGNVYNKGALVAALLDIRLLELSNGTKGLREVILELIETYGPENAFSEATFFADLTAMTYPEIEDFINRYIKGTDALPLELYFAKIGIAYDPTTSTFTKMTTLTSQQQLLFDQWSVNF